MENTVAIVARTFDRGTLFLLWKQRAAFTGPGFLCLVVVGHGSDIEQIVADGIRAHLPSQTRQQVTTNIPGSVLWDKVEDDGTCQHQSGKSPIAARAIRFFLEVD